MMSLGRLLISGPLTDGTIQNVQELLQPIWIVNHAECSDSLIDGASVGRSSISSIISVIGPQSSDWLSRLMIFVKLWVPITTSTHGALSLTSSLSFCAAHPPTSNLRSIPSSFHFFNWPSVPYNLSSAFSLIVHVLINIISAESSMVAFVIPSSSNMPAIFSESCSFIWQPNVLTKYFLPSREGVKFIFGLITTVCSTIEL